jgi:hypothetical protein
MNHRVTTMRIAFAARVYASLTANAAAWIDEEFAMFVSGHRYSAISIAVVEAVANTRAVPPL